MYLANGERPDGTYFITKTHNCRVFLQREARRRTQVITANQPAEGSRLPSIPDPFSQGRRNPDHHWARADSDLHPRHHPAMVSITRGALQTKKPPTKQQQHSSSARVLLASSLHRMPQQCESRHRTASRSLGGKNNPPPSSALPSAPAAELRRPLCSQGLWDQFQQRLHHGYHQPRRHRAQEGSSHGGCCREQVGSQASGKQARVLATPWCPWPAAATAAVTSPSPQPPAARAGPGDSEQGCGKGFLFEPSPNYSMAKVHAAREHPSPSLPPTSPKDKHWRPKASSQVRKKALLPPPMAGTTFPTTSPPVPSQRQPISCPQTLSRGWVALGFVPQRLKHAPVIAEPPQKPPAQCLPCWDRWSGVPGPALKLLRAPYSLSTHPLSRDGDLKGFDYLQHPAWVHTACSMAGEDAHR